MRSEKQKASYRRLIALADGETLRSIMRNAAMYNSEDITLVVDELDRRAIRRRKFWFYVVAAVFFVLWVAFGAVFGLFEVPH